mmetsp:Transcript_10296/g.15014  ORF Transcript_10296/g.15014 Transcript_10296/m.15014 type:complete len:87 (+) Transcript_10296:474-734(+)
MIMSQKSLHGHWMVCVTLEETGVGDLRWNTKLNNAEAIRIPSSIIQQVVSVVLLGERLFRCIYSSSIWMVDSPSVMSDVAVRAQRE